MPPPEPLIFWPGEPWQMTFLPIPAGEFLMGSRGYYQDEEPRHRVVIAEPFWMARTPVTQAQFARWTQTSAYKEWFARWKQKRDEPHRNGFPGKPDHPAESMSWDEAAAFAVWFAKQVVTPLHPELTALLPSEAHWEHACRAGADTEYHTGDGTAAMLEAGWFEDNAGGTTQPVGLKAPNRWGLHDMHGNVWEWCADGWDAQAYARRPDGWMAGPWTTTEEDPVRVMRGGSWGNSARNCRSSCRAGGRPRSRFGNLGFRLLLACGPVGQGAERPPSQKRSRRLESQGEGRARRRKEQA